jgi:SnoaL-like domain
MPWVPELFSAPVLARLDDEWWRENHLAVPYFAGLQTGDTDALIGSFAGEPELHHPVRGRIKGARAFAAFVADTNAWMAKRNVSVEYVDRIFTQPRGVEEVLLHFEGEDGPVELPFALVADRRSDGRIEELRLYFSAWPLSGRHANRPPLLQPDPELSEPAIVGDYHRALAAGDIEAIMATFESNSYVREPAGDDPVHRGPGGLREFYERLFSNEGGILLEPCALVADARAYGLEYNVVRHGHTELLPEAGFAVYVGGESGKLDAARIYDDAELYV